MSLRFSRVTIVGSKPQVSFLVGGNPQDQNDLNGWTAFDNYIKGVRQDEAIVAHVETFFYGGEEPVDATPEEVAYMYKRIEMRPDFIEARTEKCDEGDLIIWIDKSAG